MKRLVVALALILITPNIESRTFRDRNGVPLAECRMETRELTPALDELWKQTLAVEGVTPLQGGLPVMVEGKLIGAVGVSGVMSSQDEQVAQAAVDVLTNSL